MRVNMIQPQCVNLSHSLNSIVRISVLSVSLPYIYYVRATCESLGSSLIGIKIQISG